MLMAWKYLPCHRGCSPSGAAQPTTAIARMLGKAVKLRHCPATVSAPASGPFHWAGQGTSLGLSAKRGELPSEPLQTDLRLWEGGWRSASQETGPRAPNPLAFRGERRSYHACFRAKALPLLLQFIHARAAPRPYAFSARRLRRCLPGCLHPRRGHGRLRRQGRWRKCGFNQRRQSCRHRRLHRRRQLSDSRRRRGPLLSGRQLVRLSSVGDAQLLRRQSRLGGTQHRA